MPIFVNPHYEYYKYELANWTQPKFSSNTLNVGGISYTLKASHERGPAWNAFNQSLAGDNCWWTAHGATSTSNPCWISISFSKKMLMTELKILNENTSPENFKLGYLQVSNDFKSWKNINTINGVNQGNYTITVPIKEKEAYYHYRLYFTASYSSGGVSIQTLTYKGKSVTRDVPSTENDYDYKIYNKGRISKVYFESQKIKEIYRGSRLVYTNSPFKKYPPTIWLKNEDWNVSSGRVTGWNDASGLLSPSQSNNNKRPTIIENAINGHPAMHFDRQYLDTKRVVMKKAYSVIRYDNKWRVTSFNITATRDNYYPLGRGIVLTSIYGGVGGSFPNYVGSGGYFDEKNNIQGWVNGGGTGFNADNWTFGDPWKGVVKSFRGSYWLYPDRYENWACGEGGHISYIPFLVCDIAEVALYNYLPDDATNTKIVEYLRSKYKI